MIKKNICVGMIGGIASGKSTVAAMLAKKYDLKIVNPDDYWERDEPYTYSRACENWAKAMGEEYKCVKLGQSFIIDTASRVPIARRELTSVVRAWSAGKWEDDFIIVGVYVKTDLEKCLFRNRARGEKKQPDGRVIEYWEALAKEPPDAKTDGFDKLYVVDGNWTSLITELPDIRESLNEN